MAVLAEHARNQHTKHGSKCGGKQCTRANSCATLTPSCQYQITTLNLWNLIL
jgi:predicted small metal-binding protein